MTATLFLILLSTFSLITSLIVEGIKTIVNDKKNISYNLTALIVALIIGGVGTGVYYQLTAIPFTTNNIIYMILMGFASGLVSMVGFDKVKGIFRQLGLMDRIEDKTKDNAND